MESHEPRAAEVVNDATGVVDRIELFPLSADHVLIRRSIDDQVVFSEVDEAETAETIWEAWMAEGEAVVADGSLF